MRIRILSSAFLVAAIALTSDAVAQNSFMAGSAGSKNTPARSIAPPRDNGKQSKSKDVDENVRPMSMDIRSGMMTVDGFVTKVGLNYSLNSVGYLYFYVPGVGTAVVSRGQFTNSMPQQGAFKGTTLTINANGHEIQLVSKTPLVPPNKVETAYVFIDTEFKSPERFPMMGYGTTLHAPYEWPGSKAEPSTRAAYRVAPPPPLPKSVIPKQEGDLSYSVTVPASKAGKSGTQVAAR